MNDQGGIKWCTCEQLDDKACRAYLSWAAEGVGDGVNEMNVKWLLAHCHDGVTWGRLGDDHSWLSSSVPFPQVSPVISASNLLELRLFGPEREILIWRIDRELFSGRCLADQGAPDNTDLCRPDNQIRILLGNKYRDVQGGFTHVCTERGTQQAVPLECTKDDFSGDRSPLRLKVRHYFQEEAATGVIRVAASRLVDVFKKGA